MAAFQLAPGAAAVVNEGDTPAITILQLASRGLLIHGRPAIEQLRAACDMALKAGESGDES